MATSSGSEPEDKALENEIKKIEDELTVLELELNKKKDDVSKMEAEQQQKQKTLKEKKELLEKSRKRKRDPEEIVDDPEQAEPSLKNPRTEPDDEEDLIFYRTLVVRNVVPGNATLAAAVDVFGQYGEILRAKMSPNFTHFHVEYAAHSSATEASALNDVPMWGSRLSVSRSKYRTLIAPLMATSLTWYDATEPEA